MILHHRAGLVLLVYCSMTSFTLSGSDYVSRSGSGSGSGAGSGQEASEDQKGGSDKSMDMTTPTTEITKPTTISH